MDLPVPQVEAFWHGWADGAARRSGLNDSLRYLNMGGMYNRVYYDFGLSLAERGIVARDAMAYLVERCKEEAYRQGDPTKFDPYDDIRRS